MENVRKFFIWVWNTKERIVLAVVVCVLSYRVYTMFNPPEETTRNKAIPRSPQRTVDESDVEIPGSPPQVPKDESADVWNKLWKRNPFTFILPSNSGNQNTGSGEDEEIKLLDIQDLGNDRYRVRIKTGSGRPRYYSEGQKFQSFELITIDPDTGCCIVFSESVSREIEICLEPDE